MLLLLVGTNPYDALLTVLDIPNGGDKPRYYALPKLEDNRYGKIL